MSLMFSIRDFLSPRDSILQEAGIQPGFRVLDYGCGPGAYVPGAAERVGESGTVYALDLHPLAVQRVQALARSRRLGNVETICSDCETGLPDGSVDVVLLYDIFHMLSEPDAVLAELHRILKVGGALSVLDPHISQEQVVSGITCKQLFELDKKGDRTYRFVKRKR
ncbi:MAG: class I SAM-dependent methyltransferase [Anaerolineae bacterium]|nr:class I SAM-dependent methyltransferase [Anaerolineae bacterium]